MSVVRMKDWANRLRGLVMDVRPGDVLVVNKDLRIQFIERDSNAVTLVFSGDKAKYPIDREASKYKEVRDS